MHIRAFRLGDEAALWDVFFSAIHGTASAHYTPEQVEAWAPAVHDVERWAERMRGIQPFVAEHDGRIVGYADIQADGYIDHFFVASTSARQGVGSLLMERIHATAQAAELRQLFSEVSITARPFFEKCGFVALQQQSVEVRGVLLTNFRMQKILYGDPTQQYDWPRH